MFCKIPFRVSAHLQRGASAAEQAVAEQEKQDNQQDRKQGTAQEKGNQHSDCNPDKNKTKNFSHRQHRRLLLLYSMRVSGYSSCFFEK